MHVKKKRVSFKKHTKKIFFTFNILEWPSQPMESNKECVERAED